MSDAGNPNTDRAYLQDQPPAQVDSANDDPDGDVDNNVENASDAETDEATEKPGGLGQDGTIPDAPNGVAAGHTGTSSTFEPEEDEQADDA